MSNHSKLKLKILLFILLFIPVNYAFSELELLTNNQVYSEGQPLFVYGKGQPNETLIIRLFAPDETIAKFDQITATSDGSFNHVLLTWPESSPSFPFGTYTIEAINTPFRVFVQTTSDGLLIGDDPKELLQTTHVHLPSGQVETLSNAFSTLHQGLYYLDYTPREEGTYVFHVVSFSQGTISHGSVATNVLSQDLAGISNQIIKLNTVLEETSNELDTLKSEIEGFGDTLESASSNIDTSVTSISKSVTNIEDISSQLNSLLFPIVASIGIIVALQITILARRR